MLPNLTNHFIKLSDGDLQCEWNSDIFSWVLSEGELLVCVDCQLKIQYCHSMIGPPFLSARYCCIWDEKYIFVCMLKWKMITAPSWGVWNAELVTSTPEELCLYRQLLLDFLLSWKLSGYFIEFVEFKQRKKIPWNSWPSMYITWVNN